MSAHDFTSGRLGPPNRAATGSAPGLEGASGHTLSPPGELRAAPPEPSVRHGEHVGSTAMTREGIPSSGARKLVSDDVVKREHPARAGMIWMVAVAGCSVLSLVACGKSGPTAARAPDLPAAIYSAWAEGQRDVEPYVGARAYAFAPEDFDWTERRGLFSCGDELDRAGCFWPNPQGRSRIEWSADHPGVVRHEAGHAILYALGDPRWSCYCGGGTCHDSECLEREKVKTKKPGARTPGREEVKCRP